jgi:predicted nucleotide-binding protein
MAGLALRRWLRVVGVDARRNVFVVCGRDEQARQLLFDFLRSLNLSPREWESMVGDCRSTLPYLGAVIRRGLSRAQAIVVLLTADDEVRLHPDLHRPTDGQDETSISMQARPNVLIELGMALALHPDRTIVIEIGNLRSMADIAGMNTIRLGDSEESLGKVVARLRIAGCPVDDSGADWHKSRFASLDAYARRAGRSRRR